MKKLLPFLLSFGLLLSAHGQGKPETPKEKPAPAETKKAEKKAKATPEKKKGEPTESDKELISAAKKEADTLTAVQKAKLLELLNKGDSAALEAVDGIGELRAKNIIAKRPFVSVEDAAMVDGIGIGTFKKLIASVKPAPKGEEKPAKEKTEKAETKPAKEKTEKPAKKETTPAKKTE